MMLIRASIGLGLLIATLVAAGCNGNVAVLGGSGGGGGGGGGLPGASSGTGGSLPAMCLMAQDSGDCEAAFPAYWHNPSTGVCEPFTYGGCGGNANRFDSLEACQAACRGGSPDMDACNGPGECVLASPGCCGACDPVDARAFVAINVAFAAVYPETIGCGGVACGPCPGVPERERTSQYFAATCEDGQCEVFDARASSLTECAVDDDCILRAGLGCCEGCDGTGIVAINRNSDITALFCSGDIACPPCVPVIPPGTTTRCSEGRCRAEFNVLP